ncbi:ABC transporter [Bacillus cereus]|uniref:ABC transporter n=1 Tax=Bacillus cereus TaxID=1396 RepID=A0A2B0MSS7_BACCE|nr:ABC transporter [Bacillus cereus]
MDVTNQIIKLNHVKKIFNNQKVIKDISITIKKNQFTVVVGPSGSGKSTMLNVMSGLLTPSSGEVILDGKDITKMSKDQIRLFRREHVGQIFQSYHLLSYLTARENIEIGAFKNQDLKNLDQLADLLKINHILDKFPAELSGGEQQRIAIGRALIKKPKILFCDEATGALDEENSKNVVKLIHHVKKKFNITIVFITHNLEIAKTADEVITVNNGEIYSVLENKNPLDPDKMNLKYREDKIIGQYE